LSCDVAKMNRSDVLTSMSVETESLVDVRCRGLSYLLRLPMWEPKRGCNCPVCSGLHN